MIAKVRDLLDRQLGRVTMYRLVSIVLGVLAAIYILFSATGVIDGLSVGHEVLSLAVLLVASYASSRIFGLIWRIKPHGESSIITGLLLNSDKAKPCSIRRTTLARSGRGSSSQIWDFMANAWLRSWIALDPSP